MPSISHSMKLTIVGALLLLLACLGALLMLDGQPARTSAGWLYNAAGYQQAVYRGQQNGKPRLLLLESNACPRCQQLEHQLWQDPVFIRELGSWQLVRLQQDADPATALLIDRYRGKAELPLVILERAAVSNYQALYFNRDLTAFSLAADPTTAAQPLDTHHLQQALQRWQQQSQFPNQLP